MNSKTTFSISNVLNNVAEYVVSLLYPPRCAFCHGILTNEYADLQRFCKYCMENELIFIENNDSASYGKRKNVTSCFAGGWSAVAYDGVVIDAVHNLKYNNRPYIAQVFADITAGTVDLSRELPNIDYVTNVPMHYKKRKERGYDQAAIFAHKLAEIYDKPFHDGVITRTRNTSPQSLVGRSERNKNIEGSFVVEKNRCNSVDVAGKTILLADDLITTGATLCECAKTLRNAGAAGVYYITFATTSITEKK